MFNSSVKKPVLLFLVSLLALGMPLHYAGSAENGHSHVFNEWVEVSAPTCASKGLDERVCTLCGEAQYRNTLISGDPDRILVSNPRPADEYAGKTLVTIGDSITVGYNALSNGYPDVMGRILDASVTNLAINGSCICQYGLGPFNKTLTMEKVKNGDVITIMLGINDYNKAVKNGSYKGNPNYYDASFNCCDLGDPDSTDTTYRGAVRDWCEKIRTLRQTGGFENKEFIFSTMTVSSRNFSVSNVFHWDPDKLNVFGYTLREYCTALMEICAEYDVPVFDANMFSGLYYRSPEDNNVYALMSDGVHPNEEGHELLAEAFCAFILDGYTYETRVGTNGSHTFENGVCRDCRLPRHYLGYDLDCDKAVGISDVTALLDRLSSGAFYKNDLCDVNGSGGINIEDVTALLDVLAQ